MSRGVLCEIQLTVVQCNQDSYHSYTWLERDLTHRVMCSLELSWIMMMWFSISVDFLKMNPRSQQPRICLPVFLKQKLRVINKGTNYIISWSKCANLMMHLKFKAQYLNLCLAYDDKCIKHEVDLWSKTVGHADKKLYPQTLSLFSNLWMYLTLSEFSAAVVFFV